MPTLSSVDLRPVRPRPRGGLSAKFYFVVLIAAVLMIALQAIPLLHGRGSANADATQLQQDPPSATAPAQAASEQPTPDQPASQPAQPAAAIEPPARIEAPAPSKSPAADTPATTISPVSAAKPEATPLPALPGDSAPAIAATAATSDSAPPGIGVTLSIDQNEPAPTASVAEAFAVATAPASARTNEMFAFFSSVRPANLAPTDRPNHDVAQTQLERKQPEPDMWRGVLRLLSAVTKIDFTAPHAASEATSPLAEAAAPVAIPEDVDEAKAESSPSDFEPTPLSSTETLPAATQPVIPSDDESRLVIENPRETGGMIRFLVDGNVASLRPGESLTLQAGATRIQFHRGDDFENVDVELSHGTYRFSPTKTGWALSR